MNASKFVFMNLNGFNGKKAEQRELIDELFLQKLDLLTNSVTKDFENYEYSKAKQQIEQFFWRDFADNYLEIVKSRIYNSEGDKRKSAQFALYESLLTIIKLLAPIMPFITEEIYQEYFLKHKGSISKYKKEKSIHISEWPHVKIINPSDKLDIFYNILSKIRAEKTKAQKSMNSECILTISKLNIEDLRDMLEDLKNVTNAKEIKEGKFKVEFV